MRKIALGIVAASVVLAGCAKPAPNEYIYTSPEQSGVVSVSEMEEPGEYECPSDWRDGKPYVPNGVHKWVTYNMTLTIKATVLGGRTEDISFVIPSSVDDKVLLKDFQTARNYMLGTEENGLVKQGESFFYPEGFLLRASNPNIDGNDYQVCLGIDRMYVPDADLKTSTDPTIRLDRLVIPFSGKPGEEKTYTLGGVVPTTLVIKADIK